MTVFDKDLSTEMRHKESLQFVDNIKKSSAIVVVLVFLFTILL